jgi:hypothetical protein
VKSLGDGLMAVFRSASRAVACAVAMQQAVEQNNRFSAEPLGLRVGVSGGESSVEDGDYFGDPVVEAARLCSLCEGGQILATDLVRHMAGRRCPHTFTASRDRELKGLPGPVAVCQVLWEPAETQIRTPIPALLKIERGSETIGFVGRTREKAKLEEALMKAGGGARQVVFISGEPGIGKTSLCREVARVAYESNFTVLYGHCYEEFGRSYQPFAEALAHLAIHGREDWLADLAAEHGGELIGLIPLLKRRFPDLIEMQGADPDTERFRLFTAVASLLASASAETGLLLVLDDLHWADRASLQILRHLAEAAELSNVMILATYRDSELTAGHPLTDCLATLRRIVEPTRIDLSGLENRDIVEMATAIAGHELDGTGIDLAHAVGRETNGNPFFATEILRHLGETGSVRTGHSGDVTPNAELFERGLPQSIREVVVQRVDRLGESIRGVVSQAAVIGRVFDLDLLARVTEMDENALFDLIDRASEARLLTEVQGVIDRFRFTHALTQHTLYEDLSPSRRARLHRKVAEALEKMCWETPGARAGELARHYVAAAKAEDSAKALSYSMMAGRQALADLAPADAVVWFEQALQLYPQVPPEVSLECDLLVGLGTAQRQVGDPAHRQSLLRAAQLAIDAGDAVRLARAAVANNRGTYSVVGQVDGGRLEVLRAALTMLPDDDSAMRAELLSTLAVELSYSAQLQERNQLAMESVAMAQRVGDAPTLIRAIARASHAVYVPHTHRIRGQWIHHALDVTSGLPDPDLRELALDRALWWLLDTGDLVRFDALFTEKLTLSERLGQPVLRFDTAFLATTRTLMTGSIDESQAAVDELLRIGTELQVAEVTNIWGSLAGVLALRRGEHAQFLPLLEVSTEQYPDLPAIKAALADLYSQMREETLARRLLDAALAEGFGHLAHDRTWMSAATLWADTAAALRSVDAAQMLYDELKFFSDQVIPPPLGPSEGPVTYHLGLLATAMGWYELAEEHFRAAETTCRNLSASFWLARNQLAFAEMLHARAHNDDLVHASQLASEVLSIATSEGYTYLEQRATDLGGW